MFFRPAVTKNTFVYCLFARRSGPPIALEFGQLFNRLWFLRAAQFMFPFVFGKFISRPTFDCLCERYLTMIPCMLYAGDFRLMSYCVDWLFTSSELLRKLTVHKLNFVHESSRFSLCSTEHLRIVWPQPRTPTRRRQSIDVYDLPQSPTSSRIDERGSWLVRIAPVNFQRRLFVHLTFDSDWFIYSEFKVILTLVSFTGAPKFLTLTKSLIDICLSVFIYCYQNYLWLHCNSIIWLITV